MISVLIDTNIFIDVFGSPNPFREWSASQLVTRKGEVQFILSPIVWAELAGMQTSESNLTALLVRLDLVREALPFSAAYEAGRAHVTYRRGGGVRDRTLPDFFIGAHALLKSHHLLTRDAARYRSYFPSLDLICPETHP
jgi:predicted nucleic acid-binding protein